MVVSRLSIRAIGVRGLVFGCANLFRPTFVAQYPRGSPTHPATPAVRQLRRGVTRWRSFGARGPGSDEASHDKNGDDHDQKRGRGGEDENVHSHPGMAPAPNDRSVRAVSMKAVRLAPD